MAAEPDAWPSGEPAATELSGTRPPGPGLPAGAPGPATAGPSGQGLSAEDLLALLTADGELTAEQVAALARLDEGPLDSADDDPWDGDPAAGPPQEWLDAEAAPAGEPAEPGGGRGA